MYKPDLNFSQRRVNTNADVIDSSRGLRSELNLIIENGTHDSISERGGLKES